MADLSFFLRPGSPVPWLAWQAQPPHWWQVSATCPLVPKSVLQARSLGSLSAWADPADVSHQLDMGQVSCSCFSAAWHVPPLTELLGEVHDQQVRWTRSDSVSGGVSLEKQRIITTFLNTFYSKQGGGFYSWYWIPLLIFNPMNTLLQIHTLLPIGENIF